MREKENYKVVKHNSLINAESKFPYTLNQAKLICHLISNIKPNEDDFETKAVSLRELGFVGENSENYTYFKEEFLKLLEMPFQIPGTKWWTNWFSSLSYDNGGIEYRFDPLLKPFLLNLKDNFSSYQLKNILLLKSAYSIKIYELLNQYKVVGKRTIEIKDLRILLNLSRGYKNPNITNLLKEIQEELTTKTDLTFDFKPIKKSREFIAFEFDIKSNNKTKKLFLKNLKNIEPI